jgi:hypothetical protein
VNFKISLIPKLSNGFIEVTQADCAPRAGDIRYKIDFYQWFHKNILIPGLQSYSDLKEMGLPKQLLSKFQ